MYATLRDELLEDECLTSAKDSQQSKDAQEWFKEVGTHLPSMQQEAHDATLIPGPLAAPPSAHMSTPYVP